MIWNTKAVYIDLVYIKASSNKKKKVETYVQYEIKSYQRILEKIDSFDRLYIW